MAGPEGPALHFFEAGATPEIGLVSSLPLSRRRLLQLGAGSLIAACTSTAG